MIGALALAALTAFLRVAADKHYLSDVLVGSTPGILSCVVVPWLIFG